PKKPRGKRACGIGTKTTRLATPRPPTAAEASSPTGNASITNKLGPPTCYEEEGCYRGTAKDHRRRQSADLGATPNLAARGAERKGGAGRTAHSAPTDRGALARGQPFQGAFSGRRARRPL